VLGSAMAAFQRNVKRMLAWSGVAHAGTLLVGFVAGTPDAFAAVGFYVSSSLLATLGAFGVVLTLATGGRESERIDDFAGLGRSRPGLAACMTLFLLALVGIPGTAGFWAKWLLFGAAVEAAALPLVVVALFGTLACLHGTWRVIVMMYVHEAPEAEPIPASTSELAVLVLCAAGVLWLGFLPDSLPLGGEGGLLQAVHSLVLRTLL
jgi:NADH-quinone oxidoreductase subunit N